jgi:hypothetical protein
MKRNLMALPCLLALVLACGEGRSYDQDTGAVSGEVEDTTAAPSVDASDTGLTPADTALVGDTGASSTNQDQSGVTNSETGESQLGDDVTKSRPDEGEPVTSKGDTVGTSGAGATSDTAY